MSNPGEKSERPALFDMQRKVISHMTSESWKNIPHVTYVYEPDITDFINEYTSLAETKRKAGTKVSINTIMLRTIIEGLKSSPKLNSLITYNHRKAEGTLFPCGHINIAIPWLLPDGRMITPVIIDTETMTLDELSGAIVKLGEKIKNTDSDELLYSAAMDDTIKELKHFNLNVLQRILAAKVTFHPIRNLSGKDKKDYYLIPEDDRLTSENLTSATVTISNIGSLYKDQKGFFCILEIVPPQIFAIGLGAIQEKPGVFLNDHGEKEIGIRKIIPMCLAFDHRAVDFIELIPFLQKMDEIFAKPDVIHSW
jgi:pyruvate/2-oxoglutarate dehydrogenase complex dihydrolipoamide acyltransferase (E2) component